MCDTGLVQLRGVYRSAHLEVVVVGWCMKKDTLYSCVVVGRKKNIFLSHFGERCFTKCGGREKMASTMPKRIGSKFPAMRGKEPKMASFTTKGSASVGTGSKAKTPKVKDYLVGEDYEGAGMKFFAEVFGLDDPDHFTLCVKKYCDKYKRTGKDGNEYTDLGGFSPAWTRRALGALYGDNNYGGLMFTMASWFDTGIRQDRLKAIVGSHPKAGAKPRSKK
jgi:hypothetical protein